MKQLFLAAHILVIMFCAAALYAAELPEDVKPEMKEVLLKYGNQAVDQSKEELKKLIEDEMLKKNLEAVRKTLSGERGDAGALPANQKEAENSTE